ncbi:MAG: hypothetical protein EXX96DRAFT_551073 [Benjaminiella poitrasii]|nr:MAG: hypothetical protein EXX96DRAFT_551073 [Benjaminiella poitrasii]
MQMTDENDFKHYGIHKQRDCLKLSAAVRSIHRSSFGSLSSSSQVTDEDDESAAGFPSPLLHGFSGMGNDDDISSIALTEEDECDTAEMLLRRLHMDDEDEEERIWPNSKIRFNPRPIISNNPSPPRYTRESRRCSLPVTSTRPPRYGENVVSKRHNSYSEGMPEQARKEDEVLPKYTCTVHKMGYAQAKIECSSPGVKARRRPWRDVYMELQGTVLKVYENKKPSSLRGGYRYLSTMSVYYQQAMKYIALVDLSLSHAKISMATDYIKKPNVFRIITSNGPQVLFHVQTNAAALLWTEKISAGINIAVDLEYQRMPKFSPTSFLFDELSNMNDVQSRSIRTIYDRYANEERRMSDEDFLA